MPDPTPVDVQGEIRTTLDKLFGSSNWRGRVEETVKDNFKLRRRYTDLKNKFDELEKTMPKDGEVLFKKSDVELFEAFKKLGKKPEEITAVFTEHGTLKVKDQERVDEAKYVDAAEALGYKNVPALTRVLTREQLVLDFKDVRQKDEETQKVVTVRMPVVRPKADEKAALEPLEDYLDREMPDFIAVFQSDPEEAENAEEEDLERQDDGIPARAATRSERMSRRGVTIASTKGIGPTLTPASKNKKVLDKAEEEARASGQYSI